MITVPLRLQMREARTHACCWYCDVCDDNECRHMKVMLCTVYGEAARSPNDNPSSAGLAHMTTRTQHEVAVRWNCIIHCMWCDACDWRATDMYPSRQPELPPTVGKLSCQVHVWSGHKAIGREEQVTSICSQRADMAGQVVASLQQLQHWPFKGRQSEALPVGPPLLRRGQHWKRYCLNAPTIASQWMPIKWGWMGGAHVMAGGRVPKAQTVQMSIQPADWQAIDMLLQAQQNA